MGGRWGGERSVNCRLDCTDRSLTRHTTRSTQWINAHTANNRDGGAAEAVQEAAAGDPDEHSAVPGASETLCASSRSVMGACKGPSGAGLGVDCAVQF